MTDVNAGRRDNYAMWEAATPVHLGSPLYDVAGFTAGAMSLRDHEVEDLGDVSGRRLVHLQCHIGLDTLSWARRGAAVTGVDFSPAAIAAAEGIARDIGVDARFVVADVYDAPAALGGETFDIVYTGVGALCWLPDIAAWARTVTALLAPGGELYLFEFHPVEWMLDDAGEGRTLVDGYRTPDGYRGGSVTYAGESQHHATLQWNHGLGDVITALVQAGLVIETLRELDGSVLQRWPGMTRGADGLFHFPPGHPSPPLMYVLRARAPATSGAHSNFRNGSPIRT